jgi:alkylhydroperoxidase family enzyme
VIERPNQARIPPLPLAEADDQQRALLSSVAPAVTTATASADGASMNIFATFVRHAGLFRHWMPFGGKLLSGKLPARDREILILRTGWNCRSEYEWGQHVRIGLASGLTQDEVERIASGPGAEGWSEADTLLLRAADELHGDACLADGTWNALAARYDEKQLIEIPMLVGQYHLVAFTLNSLGVQREPGVVGFPDAVR